MHNIKPTKAQESWMQLKYGMFLHFGPNTLEGKGWGDGTFPAERFDIKDLDVRQWAEVAKEAGMKYAVLTTKHHDGFCLWPTRFTDYSVKNSPLRTDIVDEFVKEFRSAGLKVGLYYSLWDRNFPNYEDDELYFQYMKNQISELLGNYGDILELWFDGAWDKDYTERTWEAYRNSTQETKKHLGKRWRWEDLYRHIHSLQPDCLVINNSSSDYPGFVKYHPVDLRTSEHFDFIYKERICLPITNPVVEKENGESVFLPLEFCTSLNPDWFWTGNACILHPSVETLCGWRQTAISAGANFLLNVGPASDGKIPEYNRYYLRQAAQRMKSLE